MITAAAMSGEFVSEEDVYGASLKELQAECRRRHLRTTGRKAELQDRLLAAMIDAAEEADDAHEGNGSGTYVVTPYSALTD